MTDEKAELNHEIAESKPYDYRRTKRRIVFALIAYAAFMGAASALVAELAPDLLLSLPVLVLGVAWCFADAGERGITLGKLFKIMLVLCFGIGFPLYIFRSRGFGGVKTLALAVLLVAAMTAVSFSSCMATIYVGQLFGYFADFGESLRQDPFRDFGL